MNRLLNQVYSRQLHKVYPHVMGQASNFGWEIPSQFGFEATVGRTHTMVTYEFK
jgi:hypothetical protein